MTDLTNNTTDDWEVCLSPALHKVTWGESIEAIKPLIQRGMNGIVGFCSVLVFFIQKQGTFADLIHPCVECLCLAVESL